MARGKAIVLTILAVHGLLLAWIDRRNTPVSDELAHLAAGVYHWEVGRFDLYEVNPPLVRGVAALPVLFGEPVLDPERDLKNTRMPGSRHEWSVGLGFVRDNLSNARSYFTLARWACIPFSLIGGYFCWRWANELYGSASGVMALSLWCFSPNILAWSSTICPDAAAAALGLTAGYFFWRWIKSPSWELAGIAGLTLGLAQITKMTWIVLFAIWPLLWIANAWAQRGLSDTGSSGRKQVVQLTSILLIGMYVMNLAYGFDGTFSRLGDFTFVSRMLAGDESTIDGGWGGNRFRDSLLGKISVPLPRQYVLGMDLQKADFERGMPSYLLGRWQGNRSHPGVLPG